MGGIMPNIAKVLREEVTRIARKEVKLAIAPIRKPAGKIRSDVAELKGRVSLLEKELKRLTLLAINLASTQPAPAEAPEDSRAWISGKGIKALRKKLGLTQGELAKMTGVSKGAVVQWESKPGMVKFRDKTKKSVMSVRELGGKAEARKMLDAMVLKKLVKVVKKTKMVVKKAQR
jgi:DNA-binding transcriptional regulator YiaG